MDPSLGQGMGSPSLRELLAERGYEVVERRGHWHECLLRRGDESWFGRGECAEAALRDALVRALPSRLGRDLLADALGAVGGELPEAGADAGTAPQVDAAGDFGPDGPAEPHEVAPVESHAAVEPESAVAQEPGATAEPESVVAQEPDTTAEPESAVAQEPDTTAEPEIVVAQEPDATPAPEIVITPELDTTAAPEIVVTPEPGAAEIEGATPEADPTAAPAAEGPPRPSIAEIIDAVADLHTRIESEAQEVALWVPGRQRLQFTAWVAEARDWQEAAGGDPEVMAHVSRTTRLVGQFSREWWPGLVPALGRMATPAQCQPGVGLNGSEAPACWASVGELASTHFTDLDQREAAEGADEAGWWDASALEPHHRDPDSLLGDVRHLLEDLTGPLDAKKPPSIEDVEPQVRTRWSDLLDAARKLRWIRGDTRDPMAWARAMGRFRWLDGKLRAAHGAALQSALDPRTAPPRSWSSELGHDPKERELRKARTGVLRRSPQGSASDEEVLVWLQDACNTDLEAVRVATLLDGHRDLVLLLEPKDFSPARHARTKLKKVQKALREEATKLPPRSEVLRELEAPEEPENSDLEPVRKARADPLELMRTVVLPSTKDTRALLVSNRADPDQDRDLEDALGFSSLEHEVITKGNVNALAKRVAAGRYDFVLCATGFISHAAEKPLRKAAQTAGVLFVRANRARRGGCIRALHRDLGLTAVG